MDIIVNGARGRMGQEVCRLLQEDGTPGWPLLWTVPARRAAMPVWQTTQGPPMW